MQNGVHIPEQMIRVHFQKDVNQVYLNEYWNEDHHINLYIEKKTKREFFKKNCLTLIILYLRISLDKFAFDNCKISNDWFFVKNIFTPPVVVAGGLDDDFAEDINKRRSLHVIVDNELKN